MSPTIRAELNVLSIPILGANHVVVYGDTVAAVFLREDPSPVTQRPFPTVAPERAIMVARTHPGQVLFAVINDDTLTSAWMGDDILKNLLPEDEYRRFIQLIPYVGAHALTHWPEWAEGPRSCGRTTTAEALDLAAQVPMRGPAGTS